MRQFLLLSLVLFISGNLYGQEKKTNLDDPVIINDKSLHQNAGQKRKHHEVQKEPVPTKGSGAGPYHKIGDKLVFIAIDEKNYAQPWITDGTKEGTRMIKKLLSTEKRATGTYGWETLYKGKLYFIDYVKYALCVTDGTYSGTKLICNLPKHFTLEKCEVLLDRLTFMGYQFVKGDSIITNAVIYTINTTTGELKLSLEIENLHFRDFPSSNTVNKSQIYFTLKPGHFSPNNVYIVGKQQELTLWCSDNFTEPVFIDSVNVLLHDRFNKLHISNSYLLYEKEILLDSLGNTIWILKAVDCGTGETRILKHTDGKDLLFAEEVTPFKDGFIFIYGDTSFHQYKLSRTAYYNLKTNEVTNLFDDSIGPQKKETKIKFTHNGLAYLNYGNGHREYYKWPCELWVTDGTKKGTKYLKPIWVFGGIRQPGFWDTLGAEVIFVGGGPEKGLELWKTDGTPEGTYMAADVSPEGASLKTYYPTFYKNGLIFTQNVYEFGRELWRTDFTLEGTRMIKDINLTPKRRW